MENTIPEKDPNLNQLEIAPVQKNGHKRVIFVIISIIIFCVFGAIIVFSQTKSNTSTQNLVKNTTVVMPTPTPGPFYEMTIPYLRSRSYDSSLGNLELSSDNSIYKSYLTNYNSDGYKVNAQLTIPNGEKPQNGYPAIIFVHGYIPPSNYQTLVSYSSYVDYLARNGFVVLKIDLRGHGSSEGEAKGAYYSSDYIIDVLNARSALRRLQVSENLTPALSNREGENLVNSDKIGIWGHSMAGNVTLRTLAAQPQIPAAVIWAGAVYTYDDWEDYGIQDGSYRPPNNASERQKERERLFNTHGRFDNNNSFWRTVAATNYLKDIKGAIQLNHAIDDDVVNIGYSRNLSKLLEENGVKYELKEYSSGGHNISGISFNTAMGNTVSFFKENLQ